MISPRVIPHKPVADLKHFDTLPSPPKSSDWRPIRSKDRHDCCCELSRGHLRERLHLGPRLPPLTSTKQTPSPLSIRAGGRERRVAGEQRADSYLPRLVSARCSSSNWFSSAITDAAFTRARLRAPRPTAMPVIASFLPSLSVAIPTAGKTRNGPNENFSTSDTRTQRVMSILRIRTRSLVTYTPSVSTRALRTIISPAKTNKNTRPAVVLVLLAPCAVAP
jgi:hypothetical protein